MCHPRNYGYSARLLFTAFCYSRFLRGKGVIILATLSISVSNSVFFREALITKKILYRVILVVCVSLVLTQILVLHQMRFASFSKLSNTPLLRREQLRDNLRQHTVIPLC